MILWRRLHPLATILNHLHPAYGQPSAAAAEFQKWPRCTQRGRLGCLYLVARQTRLKAMDFQASKQIQTAARRFARIFQTAPDFFGSHAPFCFETHANIFLWSALKCSWPFFSLEYGSFEIPCFKFATQDSTRSKSYHIYQVLKALWWRDRQHVAQAPAPCLGHSGCIAVPIPRLKAIQILKGLS